MPFPLTIPDTLEGLADAARAAGAAFDAGGLVIFPTETVYGIGASAASDTGHAALLNVKGREQTQPFTIHLPQPAAAGRYVDVASPRMKRLIAKLFPGPVTLVVDVPEDVIASKMQAMEAELAARGLLPAQGVHALSQRLYHHNTIGLRCPDSEIARQVLGATIAPVVASSANQRGEPPPLEVDAAAAALGHAAEVVIDGGRCRYAKASTIIRVKHADAGPVIRVEREGVYDERTIRRMLRWTMLLVCSGNTCRSPMAEVIARQMLAKDRGAAVEDLDALGLRVLSAGAFTSPGLPATREAVTAMEKLGLDLSHHRSRELTPQLIQEADVIFCMTESHRQAVLEIDPSAAGRTDTLDPNGDIEDPIGGNLTVYQRCAELIRRRLEMRIKEEQP